MTPSLKIRVFKGAFAAAGVLSAIVAVPVLYAASVTEKFTLKVQGMRNSQDGEKIRRELKRNPAVVSSRCDQQAAVCHVEIDPSKIKREEVASLINEMGFQAYLKAGGGTTTVKDEMAPLP